MAYTGPHFVSRQKISEGVFLHSKRAIHQPNEYVWLYGVVSFKDIALNSLLPSQESFHL